MEPLEEDGGEGLQPPPVEEAPKPAKVRKRWYRISRPADHPGPKLLLVRGRGRSFPLERGGKPVIQQLHPEKDEAFLREMRERYDVEDLGDEEAQAAIAELAATPQALDSGEEVPEVGAVEIREMAPGETLQEGRIDLSGPGPVTVPVEVEAAETPAAPMDEPRRKRRTVTEG